MSAQSTDFRLHLPEGPPLVECVPNFSEGRDPAVIAAIVGQMAQVPGARVLHVDRSEGAHRTVVTLAGAPEAVVEAAFRGVREALDRIDLRQHQGVHPRLGVADVVPLVPLRGLSLADCADRARALGARMAEELDLPVYLYEAAASDPSRRSLARLRRGQAESLPLKLARLPPDFGPAQYSPRVARTGASVVGARRLLVAWNLTIDREDLGLARAIAARIREGAPEGLPRVRAIGWTLPEYGRSQVSTNLLDWSTTAPATVTAEVRRLAREAGADIDGSELVGLIPEDALIAGQPDSGASRAERLVDAAEALGLSHLGPVSLDDVLLERRLLALG